MDNRKPIPFGLGPGIRAIRDHIRPFLLIQVCVFAIVAAFYLWPAFAAFAGSLGQMKANGGLPFTFLSTAFAGVFLPEAFKYITRDPRKLTAPDLAYHVLVFGLNGIIVDLFYRFQGNLFGTSATIGLVLLKVLFDQAVASPLMFNPYFLFMMLLRKSGFNWNRLRPQLRLVPFYRQMWPILVASWGYWMPALCGIYALPGDIQFVLFLFVEAAWSLIVVHVVKSLGQFDTSTEPVHV